MYWVRIDNRLIHGQIIETWLPFTGASRLIVANNALAEDALQQQTMLLAVPSRITAEFVLLPDIADTVARNEINKEKSMVLVSSCGDARTIYDLGMLFTSLNIGNLHYGPEKKQICAHVALSEDDAEQLRYLHNKGVKLDFRCVPNDHPHVKEWL